MTTDGTSSTTLALDVSHESPIACDAWREGCESQPVRSLCHCYALADMDPTYSQKLLAQLAVYKRKVLSGTVDGTRTHDGEARPHAHVLPRQNFQVNILPGIREPFWQWFEAQAPKLELHESFHHLDSTQAMAFNLFFPFLKEGRVDPRLLNVLGIKSGEYEGHFEKVLDPAEKTNFDFYMEANSGERIFFELKLSEDGFGACADDEPHRDKLEHHYRPHLKDHVDAKWLEPAKFFGNYQVMRNLSYLGRYPDSGMAFIFPKANECLKEAEEELKHIVSKTLAPRVAILYLEYLVERILEATADDATLHEHFLAFRNKYICI
jgi:hypothetical protein